jgi:hypothetical protein
LVLRAVAKATGRNDKFVWAGVPTIADLALVDYVSAPSHYERFLGYARNDTAMRGGVPCGDWVGVFENYNKVKIILK